MNLVADRLASAVGAAHVQQPDGERAVVRPGSAAEIVDVLRIGRELELPVGPALASGVVLDLSRMHNILHLDETSLLVSAQAGVTAEALEAQLGERGLTLGPLPPTSRGRTLGALLGAPRPSEATPRSGRFTTTCAGLVGLLADGAEISTRVAPRKATGPDFMHTFIGARATLGIITAATLRVHRRGELHQEAAWSLGSLEAALGAARELLVRGARPADLAVTAAPPTLSLVAEGPAALAEAERELANRVAGAAGGRPIPHSPPPLYKTPPWERAIAMAELDRASLPSSPSLRVVGWHVFGAALVDPERAAAPAPRPHALAVALKRRMDPDGRLAAWPGA
jgi:FAD/FMN-containing dehydrogenase